MYLISNRKEECTGCGACVEVCSRDCIKLITDKEEFLYPKISKEKCINCGACLKACHINKNHLIYNENQICIAAVHKDKNISEKSSSGGAFMAIAEKCINDGYIVFGVKYDKNLKVIHDYAQTVWECEEFQKSKYVLSNLNRTYTSSNKYDTHKPNTHSQITTFELIKRLLTEDKKILFTGLPCQVAALKSFLNKEYRGLLCIDLVCHGAPNQHIFDKHIYELNKNKNDYVTEYIFRNKEPIKGKINSRTAKVVYK